MTRNVFSIKRSVFLLTGFLTCGGSVILAGERPDWEPIFNQAGVEGTVVIFDERKSPGDLMTFNEERAAKRFPPASTFKIAHALFALDAGVVEDEFQTFPWDGKQRANKKWNQDQNLRSSMRHSVVWVYEGFAKVIGEQKEREYLEKAGYGNQDPSGKSPFWIKGNLKISANEQVEFLKNLYRNKLPFDVGDQRLVKDILIMEAGKDWILRGKTGWDGTLGWIVGWVEHPDGVVFFAFNIDTPNGMKDIPKREGIARQVLESIDALPTED